MNLPEELILQILFYLNYRELLNFKSFSKLFDPILVKSMRKCFRIKAKKFDLAINTGCPKRITEYLNIFTTKKIKSYLC